MPHHLSRRRFLSGALQAGVGATVVSSGVVGASLRSVAGAATPPHAAPPPAPPGVQRFVSRPDLTPPGVSVTTLAGHGNLPTEPQHLFAAVITAPGGTYPAGAQHGLMIATRRGELVWFHPTSAGTGTDDVFNFRVQTYRGQPVLTWWQGPLGAGFGTGGQYHLLNTSYQPTGTLTAVGYPSDLHEFLITPDGTALLTAYDVQSGGRLVVCHAQEVDVATNHLLFDWACYPTIPVSDGYLPTTGDYFHLNSVDLWPGPERDLLVSGRNVSAVYRISRATKQVVWQAGGKRPTFHMVGTGSRFEYQHDARPLADGSGFSIFDDASENPGQVTATPEKQSWGKVLTLDTTGRRVTLRHQYNNTNLTIDANSQGNCQLLPTGGHLVGWGAASAFSEFGPSGSAVEGPMILDGRFPAGVNSYRTFLFNWSATPPLSELALVVRPGATSGSFTGYASWNGATAVATWKLSAGSSSGALHPVASAAWSGFETAMAFTASGARDFQVAAYDAAGHLLGVSRVVGAS